MSTDPKQKPLSEEERLTKALFELKGARDRIERFEENRWALFTGRDRALIQKALAELLLTEMTGESVQLIVSVQHILESIANFEKNRGLRGTY